MKVFSYLVTIILFYATTSNAQSLSPFRTAVRCLAGLYELTGFESNGRSFTVQIAGLDSEIMTQVQYMIGRKIFNSGKLSLDVRSLSCNTSNPLNTYCAASNIPGILRFSNGTALSAIPVFIQSFQIFIQPRKGLRIDEFHYGFKYSVLVGNRALQREASIVTPVNHPDKKYGFGCSIL